MAIHDISISTSYSEGAYFWQILPSSVNVYPNDEVRFTYTGHTGANAPGTLTISSFNAGGWWTNTSNISLTVGNSPQSKFIGSSPPFATDILLFDATGFTQRQFNVNIQNPVDTVPDQFYLGANVSGVNPSQVVAGAVFIVSGLSAGANASASIAFGSWTKNGVSQSTSGTVNNGDEIQTFVTASSSYNTAKTCTFNIGGVTDSWTVTTRLDPGDGERVPIGVTSGELSLGRIGDLFGRPSAFTSATTLGDYYRGGQNVPAITETLSVPANGELSISDFYGTSTSLYFVKLPTFKGVSANSQGSGGTMTLNWSTMEAIITDSDFYVGYGENLRNVCEYSYLHSGGATVTHGSSAYSTANRQFALKVDYSQGAPEQEITGTVTFRVRHKLFQNVVLSTTANYRFFIYGN